MQGSNSVVIEVILRSVFLQFLCIYRGFKWKKKNIHQILKDIRKQKKITNLTEQDPTIFQMIASQL